jgi:hypothetical protein
MEGVTIASLASIVTGITSVAEWFWGIFTNLINMVATNDLILWPVIFAIVAGCTGLALKVIKKFGLRGRK